ncbi:porin family protein [Robertkochia solimangrovi]|uniref:porin family protein n=1 Tax=Robertkochia solimangrovi TaxID=2213046 RepID=UPI0011804CED|nr:porin family protein [Robertkochia solimangrovi]TRZ46367.1 PorT family protein [Robertkochia solimangrovi]
MTKRLLTLLLLTATGVIYSQSDTLGLGGVVDDKYFEDQFYYGLSYDVLLNPPTDVKQNNLSYGVQGGFIKDIPLNRRRNIGFGIGAGLALNVIYSELQADLQSDGTVTYHKIDDDTDYRRNNMSSFLVEFPIEFRWRTSTATRYQFWRIYGGVKLGYLLYGRSKFVTDQVVKFKNPDIEDLQYGVYFSFGYNTWNFYTYYQLNTLLKDGTQTVDGEALNMRTLNVGLIFYIL